MGDVTSIGWTDHTFNPWEGCARVSPACTFCYAEQRSNRWGAAGDRDATIVELS